MKSILFWLLAVSVGQTNDKATYQIALSVQQKEQGGLYVVHSDGSVPRRLTKDRNDIFPLWSPDGKQIAFLSLRKQDHELAAESDLAFHWFLYVMDADGKHQRRITNTPIGTMFQWSPDGSRFLFQSSYEDASNKGKDGTESAAIYVMNADGTLQKRLTSIEGLDCFPAWSPDGKQIAFCSNRGGNMDIFVMNADGSGRRRLTSNDSGDMNPIWSPDGKKIAFTSYRRQHGGDVYSVEADGADERSLANNGRPMAWSPDGNSILVEAESQIVVINTDGKHRKQLTKSSGRALDGRFSPDGKTVFFRWKENREWKIVTVGIDGQDWKQATDLSSGLGFSLFQIEAQTER